MSRLLRYAAATTVAATTTLIFAGHASAHTPSHSLSCDGARLVGTNYDSSQTNTAFIYIDGVSQNDGELGGENFGSSIDQTVPVPQTGTHTVRFVISIAEVDNASWEIDVTETVGPCTEDTTTTEAPTTTTTTEAPTTTTEVIVTTTTSEVTTSTTSAPPTTTAPTTTQPGTTTTSPSTSSSVATTSTTSSVPSTTPGTPSPSTTSPTPSSTVPECSDNPNTPEDDCAPICVPVTQPDGTNSCSPSLPATGSNTVGIIIVAWIAILAGIVALGYGAAHGRRD